MVIYLLLSLSLYLGISYLSSIYLYLSLYLGMYRWPPLPHHHWHKAQSVEEEEGAEEEEEEEEPRHTPGTTRESWRCSSDCPSLRARAYCTGCQGRAHLSHTSVIYLSTLHISDLSCIYLHCTGCQGRAHLRDTVMSLINSRVDDWVTC